MADKKRQKWSKEDIEFLIDLYMTYGGPLWNTSLSSIVENDKKAAEEKIYGEMDKRRYDKEKVQQKIIEFHDNYGKELKKIRKNPAHQPTYEWFTKIDSFPRQHISLSATMQVPKASTDGESTSRLCMQDKKLKSEQPTEGKTVNESTTSYDENSFESFGKDIAADLRKLPEHIAEKGRHTIQKVLTDLAMEAYLETSGALEALKVQSDDDDA